MKRIAIWMAVAACAASAAADNTFVADPTIFAENGKYYLTGTDGKGRVQGFVGFVSDNLTDWTILETPIFSKGDGWGEKGFWAPQIIKVGDRYMFWYTANEQIAYAFADKPEGPYRDSKMFESDIRIIDPFLFIDDDGSGYLYHVRLDAGNKINVVRLDDTYTRPDYSTLTLCIESLQPWENTANSGWSVAEGPTVIRRGDTYYMFYSSNDFRNPDYAVGLATASSPMGPWTKSEQPIISRKEIPADGTGHGDFFIKADGTPAYVFHIHNTPGKVSPRRTVIVDLDPETFRPIPATYRELEY